MASHVMITASGKTIAQASIPLVWLAIARTIVIAILRISATESSTSPYVTTEARAQGDYNFAPRRFNLCKIAGASGMTIPP
jgi:hypothetical protein